MERHTRHITAYLPWKVCPITTFMRCRTPFLCSRIVISPGTTTRQKWNTIILRRIYIHIQYVILVLHLAYTYIHKVSQPYPLFVICYIQLNGLYLERCTVQYVL